MKLLTREMLFRGLDLEGRKATFCASTESAVETPWGPEVLKMKGCRLQRYRANPVVLDSHNRGRISDIIGRATVRVDLEARELVCEIEYAPTKSGSDAWDLVRGGFLRAVSVGYSVNPKRVVRLREGEELDEIQGPALVVKEWELHEISNVPVPADQHALRRSAFYEEAGVAKENAPRGGLSYARIRAESEGDESKKGDEREEAETCPKCGQAMPERAEPEEDDSPEMEEGSEAESEDADEDESKEERALPEELQLRRLEALRGQVMAIAPEGLRGFAQELILRGEVQDLEGAREALLAESARRAAPAGTPPRDQTNQASSGEPAATSGQRAANLSAADINSLPRG